MTCKLCGEDKKLIKSHIIPESLYPFAKEDAREALHIVTNMPGEYRKRSPKGVYDPNLVCNDCEELFSEGDSYVKTLLVDTVTDRHLLKHNEEPIAYVVDDFDYEKLKFFFLTLLWRASASDMPMFHMVNLGPHEDVIAEMIRHGDLGKQEDYPVLLARFDDQHIGSAILNPHPERLDGVRYTRFYIRGYIAYIKTDKQRSPSFWRQFQMSPDGPLHILVRNLRESAEYELMKKLVRE